MFATNPDKSSHLGVLAMIRDSISKVVNVVQFESSKSKRVAKSALASELFAMIEGFDVGFSIREYLQRMVGSKSVPLTLLTDSKSLYGLVVTLAQNRERRLQIDLELLREAYERREISSVVWISGSENPADDLTKTERRNGTLAKLLCTSVFHPETISWIERDSRKVTTAD